MLLTFALFTVGPVPFMALFAGHSSLQECWMKMRINPHHVDTANVHPY
jgi:hypothetical protein